jgi:hypothetical protein
MSSRSSSEACLRKFGGALAALMHRSGGGSSGGIALTRTSSFTVDRSP